MIDSHCHLDHAPLYANIQKIINNSKKVGIIKLLTICTTLKSFEKILDLIQIDQMIFGTFGIHPHESKTDIVTKEIIIEKVNINKKIIGVGESGLDFFYNHSDKNKQISSFKNHIEASIELKMPIIVHSRNAEKETFELLNHYRNSNPKILMHCFTGSFNFFKKLEKLDTYFSASGIITFNNSKELHKTFSQIPTNRLLVETDSPYLTPVPLRGKINEPSYIKYTVEKLSELKKIDKIDLIKTTTNNFKNLFSLN